MGSNIKGLSRRLGYTFNSPELLAQALTHRSVGARNYERLEFLGDSLLSVVITYALFTKFPKYSEGELSKMRAYLVKGETLATLASELGLGEALHLGQGELKTGGHRRASILADALEAVFAAIYLDSGFDECQAVILKLFENRLSDNQLYGKTKDSKTTLQEYLQAKHLPLPKYQLVKITGTEHDQVFHVVCEISGLKEKSEGKGENRRKAEQHAAQNLLDQLCQ